MANLSGEVRQFVGEVQVVSADEVGRTPSEGTQVYAGDRIQVGESGFVALVLPDGQQMILGHDSAATFGSSSSISGAAVDDAQMLPTNAGHADVFTSTKLAGLESGLPDPADPHELAQGIAHVLFLVEQADGQLTGVRLEYPEGSGVRDPTHPQQYEELIALMFGGQVVSYYLKAGMDFYSDFGWPIDPLDPGLGVDSYTSVISTGPYSGSPVSFSGIEFLLRDGTGGVHLFQDEGRGIAYDAVHSAHFSGGLGEEVSAIDSGITLHLGGHASSVGLHKADFAHKALAHEDLIREYSAASGDKIDLDALLEASLGVRGGDIGDRVRIVSGDSGAMLEVGLDDTEGSFVTVATLSNLSSGDQVVLLLGGLEHPVFVI